MYRSHLAQSPIDPSPCDQFRDYIHISEVAEGIDRISELDILAVINLGSGKAIRLKDFVTQIWHKLGGRPDHLLFGKHARPVLERIQPYSYADLDNLESLTKWTPKLSLSEGLKRTVAELHALHLNS